MIGAARDERRAHAFLAGERCERTRNPRGFILSAKSLIDFSTGSNLAGFAARVATPKMSASCVQGLGEGVVTAFLVPSVSTN